jgi:hypothetical protein
MHTAPAALLHLLALHAVPAAARWQGDVNNDLVHGDPTTVMDVRRITDSEIRYFDIVEPGAREVYSADSTRLVLAGRGGYGAGDPSDETWNMQLIERDASSQTVIWDRGFAANGFIRKVGSEYYAFGGEFIDTSEGEWQEWDPRDGVHVLQSASLQAIYDNAWRTPEHGYHPVDGDWQVSKHQFAFDGWHGGRIDARGGADNVMMFDGKLSAVRLADGHWLAYARANMKEHGGRFVVVARSKTTRAWGEGESGYNDFQLLSIEGYDPQGPGNIYFAAVDLHPNEEDMLMGLFPGASPRATSGLSPRLASLPLPTLLLLTPTLPDRDLPPQSTRGRLVRVTGTARATLAWRSRATASTGTGSRRLCGRWAAKGAPTTTRSMGSCGGAMGRCRSSSIATSRASRRSRPMRAAFSNTGSKATPSRP